MKNTLKGLMLVSIIYFLVQGSFLLFLPSAYAAEKKIQYYRNPMNPSITSPTFMKDSMGMDYIPVYEEETVSSAPTVKISKDKQELIGVKTEAVIKRLLMRTIRTVAKIAYDPDLYVAQEEYIQSLKTAEATKNSALVSVSA